MKIGKLNMLEYCLAFAGHRTPLADRYAAQAAAEGLLYGARADGKYAGFLCGTDEADYVRIA